MTSDPEQIRRDIERTRSELSDDVNALGDKVNPGSIAHRQVGRVRGAAAAVKDSVMGTASEAADQTQHAAATVGDTVSEAPSMVAERAKGSPVAAGLIAFGLGLLASSLIPASRAEQRAAQAVKDTAEPVLQELTDAAKETAQHLQEPAQQALEELKSTASDAMDTVRQDTGHAAEQVRGQAMESKDTLQQTAR
jgi:ElaB/YqjD/DUF883 family membrane-anchored ribosome-binding protein